MDENNIKITRSYGVLPDNNIQFEIQITNNGETAISDVEVVLNYNDSLFSLENDRVYKISSLSPSLSQTAKFVLKPLTDINNEFIGATVLYKDHEWNVHTNSIKIPISATSSLTSTNELNDSNEYHSEKKVIPPPIQKPISQKTPVNTESKKEPAQVPKIYLIVGTLLTWFVGFCFMLLFDSILPGLLFLFIGLCIVGYIIVNDISIAKNQNKSAKSAKIFSSKKLGSMSKPQMYASVFCVFLIFGTFLPIVPCSYVETESYIDTETYYEKEPYETTKTEYYYEDVSSSEDVSESERLLTASDKVSMDYSGITYKEYIDINDKSNRKVTGIIHETSGKTCNFYICDQSTYNTYVNNDHTWDSSMTVYLFAKNVDEYEFSFVPDKSDYYIFLFKKVDKTQTMRVNIDATYSYTTTETTSDSVKKSREVPVIKYKSVKKTRDVEKERDVIVETFKSVGKILLMAMSDEEVNILGVTI